MEINEKMKEKRRKMMKKERKGGKGGSVVRTQHYHPLPKNAFLYGISRIVTYSNRISVLHFYYFSCQGSSSILYKADLSPLLYKNIY